MSKLVKGNLIIAFGTFIKILLTVLVDKFLALNLDLNAFASYKYGVTIVLILSTFCALGFNSSIIRTLAVEPDRKQRGALITFSFCVVFLVALLVLAALLLFGSGLDVDPVFYFATVFYTMNLLFLGVFSGLQKAGLKTYINDIFGFAAYLAFLLFYFGDLSPDFPVSYVYLAYAFFVFAGNLLFSRSYFEPMPAGFFRSEKLREYLRYSGPLFGVAVLIILSTQLDKVILKEYVDGAALGKYFAVFNISNLLPLLLTIQVFLYLPRTSAYLRDGKKNKAVLFNSFSAKWTMILASVFAGAFYFYGEPLIALLYTGEYTSAQPILWVLLLAQWINVSLGFTGQNLLALGDSKRQLYIRAFSFVLGTGLLVYLSRVYGSIGAAYAILIALAVSNFLQIGVLYYRYGFRSYKLQNLYTFAVIFISGLALGGLHKALGMQDWHFLPALITDIVLFALIMVISRSLGKKDIRMIKIAG